MPYPSSARRWTSSAMNLRFRITTFALFFSTYARPTPVSPYDETQYSYEHHSAGPAIMTAHSDSSLLPGDGKPSALAPMLKAFRQERLYGASPEDEIRGWGGSSSRLTQVVPQYRASPEDAESGGSSSQLIQADPQDTNRLNPVSQLGLICHVCKDQDVNCDGKIPDCRRNSGDILFRLKCPPCLNSGTTRPCDGSGEACLNEHACDNCKRHLGPCAGWRSCPPAMSLPPKQFEKCDSCRHIRRPCTGSPSNCLHKNACKSCKRRAPDEACEGLPGCPSRIGKKIRQTRTPKFQKA